MNMQNIYLPKFRKRGCKKSEKYIFPEILVNGEAASVGHKNSVHWQLWKIFLNLKLGYIWPNEAKNDLYIFFLKTYPVDYEMGENIQMGQVNMCLSRSYHFNFLNGC